MTRLTNYQVILNLRTVNQIIYVESCYTFGSRFTVTVLV